METRDWERIRLLLQCAHICSRLAVAYAMEDVNAIGELLDQFQDFVNSLNRITPVH